MKTIKLLFASLVIIASIVACEKDRVDEIPTTPKNDDNYSSLAEFYAEFAPKMQTHTISATTGGSFTTAQGTVVTIPANAFETQNGGSVTGSVTIEFKDIYKKSDMLLANKPTMMIWGAPIKSGGEFFIRAKQGANVLRLASGKRIEVFQPLAGGLAVDTAMLPMVGANDTIGQGGQLENDGWIIENGDTIDFTASGYIFNLYQFTSPIDSGSWCNSDNPSFFYNYSQTLLTLHPLDSISVYNTDVFLVFHSVNSMVHVYNNNGDFPYYYAPVGLQCTAVAIGLKNGKLYSAFVPITITSNLTVNFSLSETTSTQFITSLEALN